jgi:hypothetical protein
MVHRMRGIESRRALHIRPLLMVLHLARCELEGIAHSWACGTGRSRARDRSRIANSMRKASMLVPVVIGTRKWWRTDTPLSLRVLPVVGSGIKVAAVVREIDIGGDGHEAVAQTINRHWFHIDRRSRLVVDVAEIV